MVLLCRRTGSQKNRAAGRSLDDNRFKWSHDGAERWSHRPQSWTTPWNGTYQPIRTKYAENDACEHVPVAVAKNGVQIRAVQVSANALRAGPGLATSQIAVSLPQEGYISRSAITLRRFGRKGALTRDSRGVPSNSSSLSTKPLSRLITYLYRPPQRPQNPSKKTDSQAP